MDSGDNIREEDSTRYTVGHELVDPAILCVSSHGTGKHPSQNPCEDNLVPKENVHATTAGIPDNSEPVEARKKHGGWKWVVLIGCFFIQFIAEGSSKAFGILYIDIWEYFGVSKSRLAWVGSLFASLPLISAALTSFVALKLGCRGAALVGGVIAAAGVLGSVYVTSVDFLYLTFGCVAGFGTSFPLIASILVLSLYFDTRLGLATGIAECGAGLGAVLLPLVFEELLEIYKWRGTLLVLSGLMLNLVFFGSLFRPVYVKSTSLERDESKCTFDSFVGEAPKGSADTNGEVNKSPRAPNSLCCYCKDNCNSPSFRTLTTSLHLEVFKNVHYLVYTCAVVIFDLWVDVPFMYLPDRAVGLGMTKLQAAILISVLGFFQLLGNLVFGYVGDSRRVNRLSVNGIAMLLAGVCLLLVPYAVRFVLLALLAAGFGFFSAAVESLCSVVLVQVLGRQKFSMGYGYNTCFKGVAKLLGPPLAGFLYDLSGNYDNTFHAAGGTMMVCGVLYFASSNIITGLGQNLSN